MLPTINVLSKYRELVVYAQLNQLGFVNAHEPWPIWLGVIIR